MFFKKIERKIDFYIKKFTEYPLINLKDQISKNNQNFKIPPVVYQTWETNFFGKTHYKEIIKFRSLNPDLSFILFDKKKRDIYMHENWSSHKIYQAYIKSKLGVMKSDIFRHCILYDKGGYYFDISKGCKVPLRSLHNNQTEGIISNEPVDCIVPPKNNIFPKLNYPHNNFLTWGLGFKKNHLIPKMMIESIANDYIYYIDKVFEWPKLGVLSLTATGQFTKIVREFIERYPHDNLVQAGVYFNGNGIFSMKGCRVRHHLVPSYSDLNNQTII